MFGLPTWAIALTITVLQKTGFISWADALVVKGVTQAETKIKTLKTYHSDADFPKQHQKGGS